MGVLVMCTVAFYSSATRTEVFLCFFLSCKANARVKLTKTGHSLPKLVAICVVLLLSVLLYYCLCVNVYCTTATGCKPNCR